MVTRARSAAFVFAFMCLLLWGAQAARCASGTVVFLTLKQGIQTADGSGDNLFSRLEKDHGPAREDRSVVIQGIELDFYTATSRNAGLAVGVELQQYGKEFRFRSSDPMKTNEDLTIAGRSLLFTLKGFLRWGLMLPFVAVGSGNYYVQYHQSTEDISLLDSSPSVYTARIGSRFLLGRWGLLVETGATSAPVEIRTQSGNSTLNLGGTFTSVGLSWAW